METAAFRNLVANKASPISGSPFSCKSLNFANALFLPFCPHTCSKFSNNFLLSVHAKKKSSSQLEPALKRSTKMVDVERNSYDDDDGLLEELEDGTITEDDDYFEDDFEEDEIELDFDDGSSGGGVLLAGTWWDKKALELAEDVSMSFGGDLKIYAFKTSTTSTIRVRIEKMSNKYGSPSMSDIEDFLNAYRERLDEAEVAGAIPSNYSLEVSSPGVERIVRIPEELDRFKDLPMYVKYATSVASTEPPRENDGILKLISFDLKSECCTWSMADVRRNREQAGKGRPLSKKQREWRLQTPFDSLRLVRLYSEC